jgi:acyl-CoA synthetase (AMP-forming)/AMP-acid ligase II
LITEELIRDSDGLCVECGAGEPGEFLGRVLPMLEKESNWDGYYKNPEAGNKKMVGDVMEAGDRWIRTGDLMVRDWRGWLYFV